MSPTIGETADEADKSSESLLTAADGTPRGAFRDPIEDIIDDVLQEADAGDQNTAPPVATPSPIDNVSEKKDNTKEESESNSEEVVAKYGRDPDNEDARVAISGMRKLFPPPGTFEDSETGMNIVDSVGTSPRSVMVITSSAVSIESAQAGAAQCLLVSCRR